MSLGGVAWIDVKDLYLEGAETPLDCTWTSVGSGESKVFFWEATIAIDQGEKMLTCTAVDFKQVPMAVETIPVSEFPGN